MQKKDSIVIYHIFRKDGSPLFLHPFSETDKTTEFLEAADIEGKYGQEPRAESLELLRNELYRIIEGQVKRWMADQRFIPRFLISAGIFLIAYLFFSLVVRDPLPMIDEVALSTGAAVLCFILLGRRYLKTEPALRKRVQLRTKVDAIEFHPSEFVKAVEETLQKNEGATREQVFETLLNPIKSPLNEEETRDARLIAMYLQRRFSARELKKQERMLSRYMKTGGASGIPDSSREEHTGSDEDANTAVGVPAFPIGFSAGKLTTGKYNVLPGFSKLDFSLFAVYARIKQSAEVSGKR